MSDALSGPSTDSVTLNYTAGDTNSYRPLAAWPSLFCKLQVSLGSMLEGLVIARKFAR